MIKVRGPIEDKLTSSRSSGSGVEIDSPSNVNKDEASRPRRDRHRHPRRHHSVH